MVRTTLFLGALLLCSYTTASAEQYSFDFSNAKSPIVSDTNGVPLITRMLQTADEPCIYEGDKLVCTAGFKVGNDVNVTEIVFVARCDISSEYRFDYRRASGCACQAQVKSNEFGTKTCPCTVCQAEFGDNPIHVDCSESTDAGSSSTTAVQSQEEGSAALVVSPYIFSSCTSVDCAGACNGTCALNCAESDTACPYCANADENQPTATPTGAGKATIKNFSSAVSINFIAVTFAALVATTVLFA